MKGKYLLWGVLGLAGIAGGAYLFKLNRMGNELEIVTKALIHKVTLTGVRVRIEVVMKNPTGGKVKVKHPFVKLMYGESTLGSSQVKNKDYEIPEHGEVKLEPIYFDLSFISLATSAPSALKEYRSKGTVKLKANTITTINNKIPYKKMDEITIGQGEQEA